VLFRSLHWGQERHALALQPVIHALRIETVLPAILRSNPIDKLTTQPAISLLVGHHFEQARDPGEHFCCFHIHGSISPDTRSSCQCLSAKAQRLLLLQLKLHLWLCLAHIFSRRRARLKILGEHQHAGAHRAHS
jgi:hypothetical protein